MKTETIHKNQTWALISASIDSNIQTISDEMGMTAMTINHGNSANMEIKGINADFKQFNFISFNGVGFYRVPEMSLGEVLKKKDERLKKEAIRQIVTEALAQKRPILFLYGLAVEFRLNTLEGLSCSTIAKSLGISRQLFSKCQQRAKQTLENHLQ